MLANYNSHHWTDENKNPAGGCSTGTGFTISWQHGPLGRDSDKVEPNGAFVETIIAAARDRLRFYQESKFKCVENVTAIDFLSAALDMLNKRTRDRKEREVEGTHNT